MSAFAVEIADGIADVRLLGPGGDADRSNTMGTAFWDELPQVFAAIDADAGVKAVVLTGSGPNFSLGLDLREMLPRWAGVLDAGAQARPRTEFLTEIRRLQQAVSSVARCRVPVIAAVSGWCVGGGVDLIAAADIRLASADAKFSVREVKLAIVADLGSLHRLAGIIGEGHLRELALTGTDIGADRAERIGLLNHVYADAAATIEAARALAAEIVANPPLAVEGTKQMLNAEREHRVAQGLREVASWNAAFLPSEDLSEAIAAFGERRPARFTGR
ncbi:crotonase/enoyl-CoA hydratase family protein [Nakamurella lactea]|uniref:crotonase/enoyl-CoA hydratase family protein n=1 Tax=Nakamurella lactea TaxID=459515 RepID=UPI000417FAF5|nr:crotonase/enoyl-CoA hydratase family protein [Nakamurella lactea]